MVRSHSNNSNVLTSMMTRDKNSVCCEVLNNTLVTMIVTSMLTFDELMIRAGHWLKFLDPQLLTDFFLQ